MRKKVSEIDDPKYGEGSVSCEPSVSEIEIAVRENYLETRGFQRHLRELLADWGGPNNFDEIRKYHARRIAFFVKLGWSDPIVLKSDRYQVEDGLHRLKAARFLKMEYVAVLVSEGTT